MQKNLHSLKEKQKVGKKEEINKRQKSLQKNLYLLKKAENNKRRN